MENVCCPRCGSQEIFEILYGMPTAMEIQKAVDGKAVLAGCMINTYRPGRKYYCLTCEFKF